MGRFSRISPCVLKDVGRVLGRVEDSSAALFVDSIMSARRVYVAGAGRSLDVVRAFARRLAQAGKDVYVAGGANSPPAGGGDLLVACSGSGDTPSILLLSRTAKKSGCRVAAVTSKKSSPLARLSDTVLCVPFRGPGAAAASQPLNTLFEQSAFIVLDCAVLMLMEESGVSEPEMKRRHANLE